MPEMHAPRIGVLDGEMSAHQRIRVIELRPAQQIETAGVHQDPGARCFDHEVVGSRRRLIQVELILKAAASARENGHS